MVTAYLRGATILYRANVSATQPALDSLNGLTSPSLKPSDSRMFGTSTPLQKLEKNK